MPMGRWGTVAEAAEQYGVSRQWIHRLIRKGAFAGARRISMPRGDVWLLPWPFNRKALKIGRPRKGEERGRS